MSSSPRWSWRRKLAAVAREFSAAARPGRRESWSTLATAATPWISGSRRTAFATWRGSARASRRRARGSKRKGPERGAAVAARPAGRLHLPELHRPQQSLARGPARAEGICPQRHRARQALLRLLLDLRPPPALRYRGLVCGSLSGPHGARRRRLSLVHRHPADRGSLRTLAALRRAPCARRRRISCLSL